MNPNRLPFTITAICFLFLTLIVFSAAGAAEFEWHFLSSINLGDEPLDIAISKDESKAYVLCNKNIVIVSIRENKILKKIPLTESFERIAIASNQETLLLSSSGKKSVSFLNVYPSYDFDIDGSPIIGNPKAPIAVYAFLDYQ